MMASLIFVFASLALMQFFFWYCRSLIAATNGVELSDAAREVAHIRNHRVSGEDFVRLHQLVHLCPEAGGDAMGLRVIRFYYAVLGPLRAAFRAFAPAWADWADRERAGCAYFNAVTLDARIARTRVLLAQQSANQL